MNKNIYDIAKDLKLSTSTISKVLNNSGNISEQTRKKVNDYVREVGFVPTSSARNLKIKNSYTIGIVYSELMNVGLEHHFFSAVLQHFKNEVEKYGYELCFITPKIGESRLSYLEWCRKKNVNLVFIVCGTTNDPGIEELLNSSIICVSTDLVDKRIYSVRSSNEQALDYVFHYFDQKKYQNIACISAPLSSYAFKERLDIFKRKIRETKRIVNEKYIEIGQGFGYTSGYQSCKKIIENNLFPPDCIFAFSDDLALGVLACLRDLKIDVPGRIEVIGFDNIRNSEHFVPSLTTIDQNKELMGQVVAKILIDRANGRNVEKDTLLNVKLIERKTTK